MIALALYVRMLLHIPTSRTAPTAPAIGRTTRPAMPTPTPLIRPQPPPSAAPAMGATITPVSHKEALVFTSHEESQVSRETGPMEAWQGEEAPSGDRKNQQRASHTRNASHNAAEQALSARDNAFPNMARPILFLLRGRWARATGASKTACAQQAPWQGLRMEHAFLPHKQRVRTPGSLCALLTCCFLSTE